MPSDDCCICMLYYTLPCHLIKPLVDEQTKASLLFACFGAVLLLEGRERQSTRKVVLVRLSRRARTRQWRRWSRAAIAAHPAMLPKAHDRLHAHRLGRKGVHSSQERFTHIGKRMITTGHDDRSRRWQNFSELFDDINAVDASIDVHVTDD